MLVKLQRKNLQQKRIVTVWLKNDISFYDY